MASEEERTIDNFFVCAICEQCLQEPKELPCKHMACRDCLQNYILNNAQDQGFECPSCKKLIRVKEPNRPLVEWADKIPTNYELMNKLQKMNLDGRDKRVKFCEPCMGKFIEVLASRHCRKCDIYFCDNCGNMHWLLKGSDGHKIVYLDHIEAFKRDPLLSSELNVIFNVRHKPKIGSGGNNLKTLSNDLYDEVRCLVTGACFLDDGCIVIVDQGNKKLKLFDTYYHFITAMSMDAYDIVHLGNFLVALTCPCEKMMRFYNLQEHKFIGTGDIETEDMCYGLCLMNDKIVVGCAGSVPNLKIIDENGELRTTQIQSGKFSLKIPYYVTYINSKSYFYVSDIDSKCAKCLKADGSIVWEREIKDARGLAVCRDYLLMARQDQITVDIVNHEGQCMKSIISVKDGVNKPHAICVKCYDDNISLLLSDDTDLVSVFTLEDPMLDRAMNAYHNRRKVSDASITSDSMKSKQTRLCSIL
ncbi:hypothetical protein CHS0354_003103 [Potamilus streckersoni]|uniref:RING-type domain-containing protein n=1 Tax=Potamilus streckersoni TaxID=2493646 RepID=A0AAE0RPP7_9BIVA|nr:hypothetical protein CHS0354_003103 [Potamilus streckersoni]